jgi:hypothetical protein
MSTKLLSGAIAAFAIGASLAGCPGELDDEARFRVDGGGTTGPCDATPIFKASCNGAGCHNATDRFSELDLETPGIVGTYKDMKTKGGGGMHLLIDSTSPEKSAIYTKTKSPPSFGLQMPASTDIPKLTAAQQACILSWIKDELAKVGPGPSDTGTTADTGGGGDAGAD